MECLFIKNVCISKYSQFHILQDISDTFVHLLRNKFLELFIKFCFLRFSGHSEMLLVNEE